MLSRFTTGLWGEVKARWPIPAVLPPAAERDAFVAFAVVALVLVVLRYAERPLWKLLPGEIVHSPQRAGFRDLFWAAFTSASYLLPVGIHLRLRGLRWADIGLTLRGVGGMLPTYVALYVLVLPLVLLASLRADFRETYPMLDPILRGTGWALVFEALYAFQFVALELLFRGYMLFLPGRVVGAWAVPAMILPYVMIHLRKPLPECLGAAVTGFLLGCLAMKSRSVVPGVLLHIAVAWTMDALAWVAWRSG